MIHVTGRSQRGGLMSVDSVGLTLGKGDSAGATRWEEVVPRPSHLNHRGQRHESHTRHPWVSRPYERTTSPTTESRAPFIPFAPSWASRMTASRMDSLVSAFPEGRAIRRRRSRRGVGEQDVAVAYEQQVHVQDHTLTHVGSSSVQARATLVETTGRGQT